ncbi:PD-(D/E)XK nuclease domain-containing protein, partial [Candidatus Dependentiae bacterium]|nr:PD-(D/E)XK nuclease domain-containing protein [Candidatus Dependentiae bacterium]
LLHLLKKNNYILQDVEHTPILASSLSSLTIEDPQLATLLFQTGYLTISSYNKETNRYTLAYPNNEVRQSYSLSLMAAVTHKSETELYNLVEPFRTALLENTMDELVSLLRIIFAHIPYQIGENNEKFYHRMIQGFVTLLGFESESEVSTNRGRIDFVVYTKKFTYIFEFKVNASPDTAFKQIEERAYYERFLSSNTMKQKNTLVLVGLAFSKRNGEPTISCVCKIVS